MGHQVDEKAKLLIMASWGSRSSPTSPLLRFVRDYASILKKFDIHATRGTGRSILSTGLYKNNEVACHRAGPEGGVVQLAAMVARQECEAVIFLSDPKDLRSGVPENYAIQRVCKELRVRLVTTLAGAEQWASYEAEHYLEEWPKKSRGNWQPLNWRIGASNIDTEGKPLYLPIEQQTLALIAHDKKKEEMVLFVDKHIEFLRKFDRILTTGTTGFLVKLLYANEVQLRKIEKEATDRLGSDRFAELEESLWLMRLWYCDDTEQVSLASKAESKLGNKRFAELWKKLEERKERAQDKAATKPRPKLTGPKPEFVEKIMPLPSGPKGGDILIANEVLNNVCHAVVFFHDPGTAHPHDPDIHLFERTCQFWSEWPNVNPVYATCVSDSLSADRWAQYLASPEVVPIPSLAHRLRQKYSLRDVVIVESDGDDESDDLGKALARACAGYLHRRLITTDREGKLNRIGVAHGWTSRQVLYEVIKMGTEGLLQESLKLASKVVWSPLIGNIQVEQTDQEASIIASAFKDHYGGRDETFKSTAVMQTKTSGTLRLEDQELIKNLEKADVIFISAAPWNEQATLYHNRALNPKYFPSFKRAEAVMSGIFLDKDGKEVKGEYLIVGLGYEGFQRAAKNGAVILICGGINRRKVTLAALRGKLVSVLITTNGTAEWLLNDAQKIVST